MGQRLILVLSLAMTACSASAQPWELWHVPIADGWGEIRFGMSRSEAVALVEAKGLRADNARAGTLRHVGKLDGRSAQVVTAYVADRVSGRSGRLYHIEVYWPEVHNTATGALARYRELEAEMEERYGPPVYEDDDGAGALRSASGRFIRIFQGPEMQAVLDLSAVKRNHYQLRMTLDSPQLHPKLPGS